jgi:O-antigen/teichoic acid export membrane protein
MQTLARVKHDTHELTRAYQWMISKASVISLPALAGFGAVAPLAVPTVFGDKWAEAGQLAQVFAFMALPFTLNQFASPSLGALGASRSLMAIALIQLGLTALFTFIAAPYGLFAIAWAYVARAYLTLPLQIWLLKHVSGIGPSQTWAAIRDPFLASAIMALALNQALPALQFVPGNEWIRLFLAIALGGFVYGLALLAISPMWRSLAFAMTRRARL